ncbi:hypothetical protein HHK36_017549 [Tetracentron sinense]|uniref:Nuclear pore complex protein NUP214 n=1 Tax=Tetracentron sinense TaxID=13715 RepID=A0A834Z5I3_TETSI|nr:hypothetical protein HHK36_017549 [Tetracentron sinense]
MMKGIALYEWLFVSLQYFDWSVKGNFIAVARKNTLSILSSKFKERFCMSLYFKSWMSDTGPKYIIKVDSIKWVRPDCIILGCFQLTEDGKEDGYLVQVITSRCGKIIEASSNPIVLSFSEVFMGIIDDIVPFGGGPYLFLNYLEQGELAIAANRKNTDQHIVLLGWSLDDEQKEAVVMDLDRDNWLPRIELQENGDDNLIMGFGVDKVSLNEKVKVMLGVEQRELSPYCILLCLTLEGKLIMFHVAGFFCSGTETPVLPPVVSVLSDEEEDSSAIIPLGYDLSKTSLGMEENIMGRVVLDAESQDMNTGLNTKGVGDVLKENDLKPLELNESSKSSFIADKISHRETSTANQEIKSLGNLPTSEAGEQSNVHPAMPNQDTSYQQSCLPEWQSSNSGQLSVKSPPVQGFGSAFRDFRKTENQTLGLAHAGVGLSTYSLLGNAPRDMSTTIQSNYKDSLKSVELSKEVSGKVGSASFQSASIQSGSLGKVTFSNDFNARSLPFASSSIPTNRYENAGTRLENTTSDPGGPCGNMSSSKDLSASPSSSYSSGRATPGGGQRASTGAGNIESIPAIRNWQISPQESSVLGKSLNAKLHPMENYRTPTSSGLLDSEPELSKHFGSVKEMVKELDILLACIEEEGGFRDACTVFPKISVLALEQGIGTLSDQCRVWRNTIEERLKEIHHLLDKTMQVLARKIYMESIVKQASDSQYWDLWNRQKLSPELELKRRRMLKVNQDLTNQLIVLERHFNTIELNKFGENSRVPMGRRAFHSSLEPSRYTQSLHSLYNTMSSQLAAAEQLSECLSKQMDVLSIESPSVRRKSVAKELFETIGLAYDGDSFNSPDGRKDDHTPSVKTLPFSSCIAAMKDPSRRNLSSDMKSSEPETLRRRRDSLDRSWASYEPPKTTVKRMLLQEEHQRASGSKSSLATIRDGFSHQMQEGSSARPKDCTVPSTFLHQSLNTDIQDEYSKQTFESPSTSLFKWANDNLGPSQSIGLKSSTMQVKQRSNNISFSSALDSASRSSPSAIRNNTRDTCDLAVHRVIGKSDSSSLQSVLISGKKSLLQSENRLNQTPSISADLPTQTPPSPKKISELSNLKSGEVQTKPTVGSMKHGAVIPENSFQSSGRSHGSPFSPASQQPPAAVLHGKVFRFDTATSKSQLGETESASTVYPTVSLSPSVPLFSPAIGSSPTPLSTAPSSSSGMSVGGLLTSIKASNDASQKVMSPSSSSASTPSIFPARPFSFPTPKTDIPPSIPSVSMNSTSQGPTTVLKPPVGQFSSESDANATSQALLPQPEPSAGDYISKSKQSLPQVPAIEVLSGLASGSQPRFSNIFSAASDAASNSQSELPTAALALSQASLSTSSSSMPPTNGMNDNLDVGVTQEDEMEEESPGETTELSLGSLSGFGIGSAPSPAAPKSNPFGGPFTNAATNPVSSLFNLETPSGELFRPASFSFQSVQPSQPTNLGAFSGGFGSGATAPAPSGSGFGQPAQIGQGQQVLGSVLGTFGQSRQLGAGLLGTGFTSVNGFGGGGGFSAAANSGGGFGSGGMFAGTPSTGGFGNAVIGGGFTGVASTGGGFANVASGGGGFAGGGFSGAVSGGGFPAPAVTGGGFGNFSNKQGGGGFSAFGGGMAGTGKPQSELFTQMRK